jgi:dnd system-associated protein 4
MKRSSRGPYFTDEYNIYWSDRYESIVSFLKGDGTSDGLKVFSTNVEIITFAACIGLIEGECFKVEEPRKQIDTQTFQNHGLDWYIPLLAILYRPDQKFDILRDGNGERLAIQIFQDLACGGLLVLDDKYRSAGLKSPYKFIEEVIQESKRSDGATDVVTSGLKGVVKDIGINLF